MTYGKKAIGTIGYMGGVMAVPEPFCWSLAQMIQYNNEYVLQANEMIQYERATISFHSAARNYLVDRMLGDWLLMLDTDHVFEPDLAARMLAQMDRNNIEVLVGIYCQKGSPHIPVIYGEQDGHLRPLGDWDRPAERYLIPIASAGGGCLMARRSVFKRIKEELKEEPFDITFPFGEDHSFFKRVQKIGVQAYCDPSIEAQHLEMRPVRLAEFAKEQDGLTLERLTG